MIKKANLNLNALRGLVAALALGGLSLSASAGYAQLATPEGFSGSAGKWTYAANAANDKVYGKVIHQAGGLTAQVGGQAVKMPAAYRLAANAPRIAAAALFLHPGIRTAVGIAAWLGVASIVWDPVKQQWMKSVTQETDGYVYYIYGSPTIYQTAQEACDSYGPQPGYNAWKPVYDGSPEAIGCRATHPHPDMQPAYKSLWSYKDTKEQLKEIPLTKEEFERELAPEVFRPGAPSIMPDTVPLELPRPTPLPVDDPFINPAPSPNPQSQPFRIPTGQPSPVPNTNPQQWRQPYVDIVPAPTPESPWRVDVKPGETTSTNPNPVENPQPDSQDKPAEEQDKSLCEKHPEIAACEKVEVTDKPLPDQPNLYEPKYPDGITGVWNSKLQEIKATPLFNLAPSLLPTVSGGSCPSWKVDLSIDGWTNAGLQDVSPPCWVWDVAKLVIIASALLLARRLIFGG